MERLSRWKRSAPPVDIAATLFETRAAVITISMISQFDGVSCLKERPDSLDRVHAKDNVPELLENPAHTEIIRQFSHGGPI